MRAGDIMTSPVVTVTPDTTVKEAADLLASKGFTALPVLDDDRLIGVVTEADLVRDQFPRDARYHRAADDTDEPPRQPSSRVGDVMTTPAIGMGVLTDVVDLITAMMQDHDRSMPIVDGPHVVGIVTRRDLLRVLARDDAAIAADVRHRLTCYGGSQRWTVEVHDGVASVQDQFDDATDRHVASVLVESVPGVTTAHVTSHATHWLP
jgi:CBS domain-containing protein